MKVNILQGDSNDRTKKADVMSPSSWGVLGFISVLGAGLIGVVMFQDSLNNFEQKIKELDDADSRAVENKTRAVYKYLDDNGLRFDDDEGFDVQERLAILESRGLISSVEERVRINHDLNAIELEAGKILEDNWYAKVDLTFSRTYIFIGPVLVILGIVLGVALPCFLKAVTIKESAQS